MRKGVDISTSGTPQSFEKSNIVYMGSLVRNGHGLAVVYAIGNNTNLGSVMELVAEVFKNISLTLRLKNQ